MASSSPATRRAAASKCSPLYSRPPGQNQIRGSIVRLVSNTPGSFSQGALSTRNSASLTSCFSVNSSRNSRVITVARVGNGRTWRNRLLDGVDGSEQSVTLISDLDRGLVGSNLLRPSAVSWREIGLSDPLRTVLRQRSTPNLSRTDVVSASDKPARCSSIPNRVTSFDNFSFTNSIRSSCYRGCGGRFGLDWYGNPIRLIPPIII